MCWEDSVTGEMLSTGLGTCVLAAVIIKVVFEPLLPRARVFFQTWRLDRDGCRRPALRAGREEGWTPGASEGRRRVAGALPCVGETGKVPHRDGGPGGAPSERWGWRTELGVREGPPQGGVLALPAI